MKKTKGMQRLWACLLAFVLIATTVANDGLTVLASENETEQSSEASSETHSAETSENTNSGGEEENSGENKSNQEEASESSSESASESSEESLSLIHILWRFFKAWEKNSEGTENTWLSAFVLAGMLSILAYAGHNFFCYQQVCCTPFLFIVMGLAESAVRINERKHS